MDREEIRKTVELLRKIDVEEYGLEFHEVVAAGAVKAYLCGLPRQEALGKLRAIMKGTVLKIRGRKIFCVYGKNSSLIRNRYV